MTKIKSFSTSNLDLIRNEFQNAINEVSARLGLEAKLGRINWTFDEVSVKLCIVPESEAKTPIILGRENELIGKVFKSGRTEYTITQICGAGVLNARSDKGKIYRIKTEVLKTMIQIK
jgi:hypothetical protein